MFCQLGDAGADSNSSLDFSFSGVEFYDASVQKSVSATQGCWQRVTRPVQQRRTVWSMCEAQGRGGQRLQCDAPTACLCVCRDSLITNSATRQYDTLRFVITFPHITRAETNSELCALKCGRGSGTLGCGVCDLCRSSTVRQAGVRLSTAAVPAAREYAAGLFACLHRKLPIDRAHASFISVFLSTLK